MNTTYAVVSGHLGRGFTLYGPFDSVDRAQAWANHPNRAEETRAEFRVLPLFGGIGIVDEPEPDDMVLVPKDSCEADDPWDHLQCWGEYGHEGMHWHGAVWWEQMEAGS